jgi:hypothetical protein
MGRDVGSGRSEVGDRIINLPLASQVEALVMEKEKAEERAKIDSTDKCFYFA